MPRRSSHTPVFDPPKSRGSVASHGPGTRSFHDRVFAVTSPLRYWRLDDASSPLVDEVAGFNLTVTGSPTYQASAISTNPLVPTSQSINFTGSSWAEGTTGAIGGALSFTVFGWFQTSAHSNMVLIQQRDAAAFLGEWVVDILAGSGQVRAFGFNTSGVFEFDLPDPVGGWWDGNPHLFGLVVDQVADHAQIWIDGVLQATGGNVGGNYDSTLNIGLARDIRDNNKTYTGKMSDFGIDLSAWDTAIWEYVAAL